MILHLSLFREYFDAILAGTKTIEYRRRCDYWDRRLRKPHPWTHVKFVNGYGSTRPWMIVELSQIVKTSDQWHIHLGSIVESGNLNDDSNTRPSK